MCVFLDGAQRFVNPRAARARGAHGTTDARPGPHLPFLPIRFYVYRRTFLSRQIFTLSTKQHKQVTFTAYTA